jgi:dipeptidase D
MRKKRGVRAPTVLLLSFSLACSQHVDGGGLRPESLEVASYAAETYADAVVQTLADLVAFRTVAREGLANAENPEFRSMTAYLEAKARELGLDFEDYGAVVVVGLGQAEERIGIVAHGDVQPADPSKWARDPFTLDFESEPGRLVGRGTEDDKGPLACALYAMKSLADRNLKLERRIELIISYTEESDWDPFREFLAVYEAPQTNIAFDAQYPVVVAEKGWGRFSLSLPEEGAPAQEGPHLISFTGGSFLSQVPEDAMAVIASPTAELEQALREAASSDDEVRYTFTATDDRLEIAARGRSAHSSEPWDGRNGITHLATILGRLDWPNTPAARMLRLINDLVGGGDYAEKFGDLAYSDSFMGPLTLTLAKLESKEGKLVAGLSLRRPVGRSGSEVEESIRSAVDSWKRATGVEGLELEMEIFDPYWAQGAPQVPVLLDVFRHYTGDSDAQPVSMGGGTNARLLPNGVSFGPSMPGEVYTGHSEHEFIRREKLLLDLEMYTAALAELATR